MMVNDMGGFDKWGYPKWLVYNGKSHMKIRMMIGDTSHTHPANGNDLCESVGNKNMSCLEASSSFTCVFDLLEISPHKVDLSHLNSTHGLPRNLAFAGYSQP